MTWAFAVRRGRLLGLGRLHTAVFVQHAVSVALDDVAGWGAMLAKALQETGGPLTDDERAWADHLLAAPTDQHSAA